MATVKLVSKMIDAIDYDDETTELKVFLSNGQQRHISGIPPGLVRGFVLAKSPGDFYITQIRGRFPEI